MLIKSYSISRMCFQAHCILFLLEFCFIQSLESNEKYCLSLLKSHYCCWTGVCIIVLSFSIVFLATWHSSFVHFIYIQVLATCDRELYYHYVVSTAIVSRVWTGTQFNSTCMLRISSIASDNLQDYKLNFVSCVVSEDVVLTFMSYLT